MENEVKWYEDMPLEDITEIIKEEITNTSKSFVAIGYYLKKVRDRGIYKQGGYTDLWDFAQKECGLSMSSASRFIKINDKFSVGGNSPVLQEEYKNYGSGKLQEMINMDDEQISKVTVDTTVAQIREIKKSSRVATSQVKAKVAVEIEEQVPGQTNLVNDFPQYLPIQEERIDDLDLSMRTYNALKRAGVDSIAQVKEMSDEELLNIKNFSDKNLEEIREKIEDSDDDVTIEAVGIFVEEKEPEAEEEKEPDAEVEKEDILNTLIERKERQLSDWSRLTITSAMAADMRLIKMVKIEIAALKEFRDNQLPVVEQKELPVLKNNDQRKAWLDGYKEWPIWIEQKATGQRFYKYDLSDKVAIVVKISKKHKYENYKELRECEYGAENYYLLGIKSTWSEGGSTFVEDSSRTFIECSSNKSAIIEYLKIFQRG